MIEKSEVTSILNTLLGQTPSIRKGGTQLKYYCPKCHHYKRKLEICMEDGRKFGIFNCWTCDFSGNLYTLLNFCRADHSYYVRLGLLVRRIKKTKDTDSLEDLFSDDNDIEAVRKLPNEFVPIYEGNNRNALNYIQKRKFTECDVIRYNIGFCENGEYYNRIIIPSYDRFGNLNFFTGRSISPVAFYAHKNCDFSKNIVGFESTINFKEMVTIVEGPSDAISVRFNAIPLFGKSLSEKLKLELICNKPPRVNILLDNDALKDSIDICETLINNGVNVYLVEMSGKDPNVLGFEETWKIIDSTKPLKFEGLLKYKLNI